MLRSARRGGLPWSAALRHGRSSPLIPPPLRATLPADHAGRDGRLDRGRERRRRLLPAPCRRLPRRALRAEPGLAARADRRHPGRDRAVRGAAHLRGRRGEARADAGARAQRVGERDPQRAVPVRRRDHRLGGRAPGARAREPGAPRSARPVRSGHAGRPGGADRRPADRARRSSRGRSTSTGSARTRASPSRSSSSRSASATRPRSRSTTRTSGRGSSTRRRPTR